MTEPARRDRRWPRLVAGAACLDFVNSVDPRLEAKHREYVSDFASLLGWCAHARVIKEATRVTLARFAARDIGEAARVYAEAIAFREALYQLAAAQARGTPAPTAGVRAVAEILRRAWQHADLSEVAGRYEIEPFLNLELPLSLLAWSAEKLLTSDQWSEVRMCEAPGCGWVFLDSKKGGRRRWCSMRVCGNREKARRYAQRQRPA